METRPIRASRTRTLLTTGLFALLSVGSLSSAIAAASVPADKSWHVEGRVVDEKGTPVAGADVFTNELPYLKSAKQSKTKSGSDGRFQLDIAHQINGRLIRASLEDGKQQAFKQLPFKSEDKPVPPMELVLQPAREITGTVTDSNNKPVPAATFLVTAGFEQGAQTTTDDNGHAKLLVPAKLPLQYAIALKPGLGIDYWEFRTPDEPKSTPYKLAPDHSKPLSFILNGARTIAVRVVDEQDKPLRGVTVYPWLVKKPNKGADGDSLNLSGLSNFNRKTNDQGIATFDFIPSDNIGHLVFWTTLEGYYSPRNEFDPASNKSEVLAKLTPLVKVTGRVTLPDGKPAADVEVSAAGAGYSFENFKGSVRTDQSGAFTLEVYPDQYYQFAAGNREWASPSIFKIVRAGKPVDGLELKLQPAVRVFGRMTEGPKQKPSADAYIQIYPKQAKDGYYSLPKDEQLPNPKGSNQAIGPQIVKNSSTDEQGAFEFFVTPGKYYLYGQPSPEPKNIEVMQGKPVEVNFHAERPQRVTISGRVVQKDKPEQGVPNAKVVGEGTGEYTWGHAFNAVADLDGHFEAARGPIDMLVFAESTDHTLAAIVKVGPDDTEVTIPIEPTGSAHGRIIDEETGSPAADRQITYGIHIDLGNNGMSTSAFGGSTKTDAKGEFTIKGLVVGQEFTLNAVTDKDGEGHPNQWHTLGKATAKKAETVELGDLRLTKPYRLPTDKERVAKLFADPKSLEERLKARLRDAKFGYQRVLMVIGDPSDSLVTGFYELEYDRDLSKSTLNYLFLPIKNTGAEKTQADQAYATKLGIDWPSENDAMLVVLDEKGAVLSKTSLVDMLTERKIDHGRSAAFLNEHPPALPDAEQLLADALTKAKTEGKRVFVQVSGPRCGWCTVLSRYLDDHHDLIDKEFVYVKLDDRLKNGSEVIKRVRPKQEGGIPWMVFLDADGKPLINSDAADGNIGYPGEPEGQVHFEKMLKTATKHLTDGDIKTLIDALAKNNK